MKKTFFKNVGIIVAVGTFLFGVETVFAWTDPTVTPPGGNATTPVNVTYAPQVKTGNLWLAGLNSLGQPYTNGLIIENGRVGIGTTTPASQLDVSGVGATIISRSTSGPSYFKLYNGGNNIYISLDNNNSFTYRLMQAGNFLFKNSANVDLMTILSTGNVGISTTSPSEKLDVNGNIKATAFLYSSDISLKKNIKPIENQLDKVLSLQPVSYSWKANDKTDVGFVAQDVENIFPEVVHTNETTNLKSIDYAKLTVYLVQAIKEQQKEIEQLKK